MNKDLVFGIAALALAVAYYLGADTIQRSLLADEVGAHGLPKAYALMLGVLALVLITRALIVHRRAVRAAAKEEATGEHFNLKRAAGIAVIGVLYIAAVPYIGYILSLSALIAATIYYQGGSVTWRAIGVAAGGALFFWVLFVFILQIPQPPGLWPKLL